MTIETLSFYIGHEGLPPRVSGLARGSGQYEANGNHAPQQPYVSDSSPRGVSTMTVGTHPRSRGGERVEVGGRIARLGWQFDVNLVSTLDPHFVSRCHFQHVPPASHEQRVRELIAGARRIGIMPHSGHTLPILRREVFSS
jgi:hypothetical protein